MSLSAERRPSLSVRLLLWVLLSVMARSLAAQPLPVLHSRAFQSNPDLYANAGQLVMVDSPADGASGSVVRYNLVTGGTHTFCLKGNTPIFIYSVMSPGGQLLINKIHTLPGCTSVQGEAGKYRINVFRAMFNVPGALTYLVVDPPQVTLVDGAGAPLDGLWAIQPDPMYDWQLRDGRLAVKTVPGDLLGQYAAADYTQTRLDESAHFRFAYGKSNDLPLLSGYMQALWSTPNLPGGDMLGRGSCTCEQLSACSTVFPNGKLPEHPFCPASRALHVVDLGYSWFNLRVSIPPNASGSPATTFDYKAANLPDGTGVGLMSSSDVTKADFGMRLLYRYFPDGNPGPLSDGEVALFSECNQKGPAIVVNSEFADFPKWSGVVALSEFSKSIQLGNNTGVTLYDSTNFAGNAQTATTSTQCAAGPLNVRSLQVYSLRSVLLATGKCPGCALRGIDLTGLQLSGTDLSGGDLQHATLNQVVFTRANLQGADLSYAQMFGAQLDYANLAGASLYHAFLANNSNGNILQSASLQQAHLKNVNLSYAELSGVNLYLANIYGDVAAADAPCATTGDNWTGFTRGCATAYSATMTGTNLNGAYLFGMDFSNTAMKGVDFSDAVLVGANFSGASLEPNVTSGNLMQFSNALMQGADLSNAKLSGIHLGGAQVDFTAGGNNVFLYLDGRNHNSFTCTGCTPPTGQDVCVVVNYQRATAIPPTGVQTCPDTSIGACGAPNGTTNRKWQSSIIPENPPSGVPALWYDQDSTWTKAPGDRSVICRGAGENNAIYLW